jgi:hypothetical protein
VLPYPIALSEAVQALDRSLPMRETPRTTCFSLEGLSSMWTELVRKGGGGSTAMVIMSIMRVLVEELLL